MVARLFTPGNEPGSFVSGFSANKGLMDRVAQNLRLRGIPVGNDVAAAFPWLRYVRQPVPQGQSVVVKRRQWDNTFVNVTPRSIRISELRLYIHGVERGDLGTARVEGDADVHQQRRMPLLVNGAEAEALQKYIWVKLSIPPRRDLIQEWMPMFTLMTESDHLYPAQLDRYVIELPSPYFLNRSNPFVIDVGENNALVPAADADDSRDRTPFWFTLHGFGMLDGEPIDLVKGVPPITAAESARGGFRSVTFNDDRDLPMRDAVITHIGVGAGALNNGLQTTSQDFTLNNIQLRPHAPEGPSWHSGEFFPLPMLAKHVPMFYDDYLLPLSVRHVPVTPYVIEPGERFEVSLWNRTDRCAAMGYGGEGEESILQDLYVDVGLIGTQEVE